MKKIDVDGEIFEYGDDEDRSILDFLESKDVQLKFGCRDGYCGDCRCKLVSGDVEISDDAIGFVNDDEILTCATKPKGNIKIRNIR